MSRIVDALIAYRVLKLLVTPFNKTKAYKLGIIDEKGKVLIKSKKITNQQQRNAYTLLIRFVFNLKRLLSKVGIRGPLGSAAAAALAFFKEETENTQQVEKEVYKYLKENGFEFEMNESYGEPLAEGQYKVRHDIYDLDGEVVINKDDTIDFKTATDNILGYDVFKYQDVYLTTEDLYV
jgi:hypothetical protein|tara:strand:- start:362 stop:898 length:537 start_codon:yes stop_codon:yes gene_type:complete